MGAMVYTTLDMRKSLPHARLMLTDRAQTVIAVVWWIASTVFTYVLMRRVRTLMMENDRLAMRVHVLQSENKALLEENKELIELKLRELDIDA